MELDAEKIVASAAELPNFYTNGFNNVMSSSDVMVVYHLNGKPTFSVNMSFTTAKTLSIMLGQLVAQLETFSGHEIMTTMDVAGAANASLEDNK